MRFSGARLFRHLLGQAADHLLLIGFLGVDVHGDEQQRQFFVRIVIEERRRQRARIAAVLAREGVQAPGQQQLLQFRLFADIDDLMHLNRDRLPADGARDGRVDGWIGHDSSLVGWFLVVSSWLLATLIYLFTCLLSWQRKRKRRSFIGCALDPDAAAVRVDNGLRQIETQAAALRAPRERIVHAVEALEDAALLIQRNADALIGHGDDDFIRLPRGPRCEWARPRANTSSRC